MVCTIRYHIVASAADVSRLSYILKAWRKTTPSAFVGESKVQALKACECAKLLQRIIAIHAENVLTNLKMSQRVTRFDRRECRC